MINERPKPNQGQTVTKGASTPILEFILFVLLILFVSLCLMNSNFKKPSCSPLGSEKQLINDIIKKS